MTTPSFTITMHNTLPIMMTRFNPSFEFAKDAMPYTVQTRQKLDAQSSPVFYLFDLSDWHNMSLDELMQAAAQAARGKDSNFHHPMNRGTLIITQEDIVAMSAEGLHSAAYGNANVKVFNTVDDALNFAQSELNS